MKMPRGKYVISDPCYLWDNHDEWIALLERHNYFKVEGESGGVFVERRGGKEYHMAVSRTAYGDGSYKSTFPVFAPFDVDAGILGAIPVDLVTPEILDRTDIYIHEFKGAWEFYPCDEEGDITFHEHVIETDPGTKYKEEDYWAEQDREMEENGA